MDTAFLYLNLGGFELILFFIPALLWLWAIVNLLKSDFSSSAVKIIWALLIIFIPPVGVLLYLIIGRGQKVKSLKH